ncbi:MAG TPA: TetR/AcrR family transcriptional regulator [Terracidiphilus sp.]|nr:TetR/AcrR family transcriptional regulator [Terracidiphilus sp.]
MTTQSSTHAPSDRSTETRARILDAALREFSAHGLAGARTERIASAGGVNKALIYYYFKSKENLYVAALEMIAGKIRDSSMAVFQLDATAGERLLRAALNHFDRILAQSEFQSLLQQEMMRLHKGESGVLPLLVKRIFGPLMDTYRSTVQEGISSGELINVDWMQIHLAALGANVFYFLSAPVWKLAAPVDPFAPEALMARRKGLVEFLGQAIFKNRQHGAELAARVFADTLMPEIKGRRHLLGRKHERAE